MRFRYFFIIPLLAILASACQDSRDHTSVVNLVNMALEGSGVSEDKTLLVVSGIDCGNCYITELEHFLKTEALDATLVVGFEDSKGKKLDKKVSDLLTTHAIPVFEKESLELLVEIGKYSGSPKSPYILRYVNKELQVESLVQH